MTTQESAADLEMRDFLRSLLLAGLVLSFGLLVLLCHTS